MRLLLTRPITGDDRLEALLRSGGHNVVVEPLLTIEQLPCGPIEAAGLQAVVATSSNALRALGQNMQLNGLPLFAVGAATARLAREHGFNTVVEGQAGAGELAELLIASLKPGRGAVLYLRGEDVAFDLDAALQTAGLTVDSRRIYRAVPAKGLSASTTASLTAGGFEGIVLMSPRTAEIYLRLADHAGVLVRLQGLVHFCISNRVAAPLIAKGLGRVCVPARPSLQELVALIELEATHSRSSA